MFVSLSLSIVSGISCDSTGVCKRKETPAISLHSALPFSECFRILCLCRNALDSIQTPSYTPSEKTVCLRQRLGTPFLCSRGLARAWHRDSNQYMHTIQKKKEGLHSKTLSYSPILFYESPSLLLVIQHNHKNMKWIWTFKECLLPVRCFVKIP